MRLKKECKNFAATFLIFTKHLACSLCFLYEIQWGECLGLIYLSSPYAIVHFFKSYFMDLSLKKMGERKPR